MSVELFAREKTVRAHPDGARVAMMRKYSTLARLPVVLMAQSAIAHG